jgi:hypothetical protein
LNQNKLDHDDKLKLISLLESVQAFQEDLNSINSNNNTSTLQNLDSCSPVEKSSENILYNPIIRINNNIIDHGNSKTDANKKLNKSNLDNN